MSQVTISGTDKGILPVLEEINLFTGLGPYQH
jgi:hypothetical protein